MRGPSHALSARVRADFVASPREVTVERSDGRRLRVAEYGPAGGRPIFSLHGTPSCRFPHPVATADAAAKGIRLIGYDRPGYGGSTPQPGRSVGDVAADVAAIADDLGIERFAVYGFSGGGAPALACAARLPSRVVAAASLAGVAPYPADGLDWLEGAGELNVKEFQLMLNDRPAWDLACRQARDEMVAAEPDQVAAMLSSLLSPVDRAALDAPMVDWLVATAREGLRPGDEGMRDDNLSCAAPWGFDLTTIRVPVQLWHGAEDRFVPVSHGRWLAARIPGVDLQIEPALGHLSLLQRIPRVHAWLLARS